jgi:PAS domain S-box-containing protein
MGENTQQLFPLIFDSINDGVFTVDEHFCITSFNAAAARITGIPAKEALGRRCHEVFRADICQKRCALRHTLETGIPLRDVRVDVLNAEMDAVPIEVSTAILRDGDGHMLGGVEIFRDVSDVELLRSELSNRHIFEDMVGASPAMREIFATIPQVAQSDAPVLVRGPSGTGKELVAGAIHNLSPRRNGPFIRVNCGALPDTLLESELFGHAKGAFTGAVASRAGRFAQADRGTLFLDEIGDISPAFQVKLLRVLEEGEFQPLGDTRLHTADVRLLCATNRNLEKMVQDGEFREDLYYRIRVVTMDIPPLRERREDIPLLVEHLMRRICARIGRPVPAFASRTMRLLYDYDYPGNVRELRNILERAAVLCREGTFDTTCLPPEVLAAAGRPSPAGAPPALSGASTRTEELRALLDRVLWNRSRAARSLGISRTTLWRRMKDQGLA